MAENNVYFPVADPDSLIAGIHPMVPFAASHAILYRFANQANARAGTAGVQVASFTLIAASEERTEAAGPFRFGTYDASQIATTWYAYRFRDPLSLFYSDWSAAWQPGGRTLWPLRTLVKEVVQLMGIDAIHEGVVSSGTLATLTCPVLFKSSLRDSDFWEGAYLWIDQTTDAGAPQDEERIIPFVNTEAGIAALDSDLSAIPEAGDHFYVLAMFPAAQVKLAINTVRRQMKTLQQTPIAMNLTSSAENRYPLPQGVYTKGDIARARWWTKAPNARWDYVNKAAYDVEFDGNQAWLYIVDTPAADILMVEHKVTYYDLEGPLTDLNDTTKANIDWLAKAAAWWLYSQIDRGEEAEDSFSRLTGLTKGEVQALTGLHEPNIPAPLNSGTREIIGPVGAPV